MSGLPLSLLGQELRHFEILQIILSLLGLFVAMVVSRFVWHRTLVQRVKKKFSLSQTYVRPLLTYLIFVFTALIIALGLYPYSNQLVIFNLIFQISIFGLLSHYVYLLSKSKLLYGITFLALVSMGYFYHLAGLSPSLNVVNNYAIEFGSFKVTPWLFLKSLFTILVFLWITSLISHQFKRRIKKIDSIKTGTKEILTKTFDIFVYFIALLLILNVLGINLSALTVIGGALGVGIGFGLQKITSNFISGLILLFEKSIEIDDLVELNGGIYGFVRRLGSRYTLVETFDGKEILVPNEDFITSRVTNWTFSNKSGRIEIKLGVSYKSDIKKAQQLILEAAKEHPHCIKDPPPKCFLREFGDSSVNFLLFFFVGDVTTGRWETQSEVMMAIWDKFKAHHIEIPFPQRDIHIKTGS